MMRFARAALTHDATVTIRIVNAEEGRALNHTYRGKDYATNVLSFVYDTEPTVCGDLVLCAPVVSDEATAQGKSAIAHYAHLIVHGVLHLHGLDHQTDFDAALMEARETAILSQLGFADPYTDLEPR
jgi:probable rRNA maturation factor